MAIEDRMTLATERPLRFKLMAAMAQQDCGQCGYNCSDYSRAIFEQAEPRLNLCQPGGKATARMLKQLVEEMGGGVIDPEEVAAKAAAAPKESGDTRRGYSRNDPVQARFVSRTRLNGDGSEKLTNHIEIDLSAIRARIRGRRQPRRVPHQRSGARRCDHRGDRCAARLPHRRRALPAGADRTHVAGRRTGCAVPVHLLSHGRRPPADSKALAKGEDPDGDAAHLDVLGALRKFAGIRPDPEALIEVLEPLQPRLYSISSSPKANPGRVSLTVDTVHYEALGRERLGVASTWLGGRIEQSGTMLVYVQKAHNFGLPENGETPIIMVGPGTGVAPFRAFLHERMATGASGPSWLFFGHQREAHDFFYRDEWDMLTRKGALDPAVDRLVARWRAEDLRPAAHPRGG